MGQSIGSVGNSRKLGKSGDQSRNQPEVRPGAEDGGSRGSGSEGKTRRRRRLRAAFHPLDCTSAGHRRWAVATSRPKLIMWPDGKP